MKFFLPFLPFLVIQLIGAAEIEHHEKQGLLFRVEDNFLERGYTLQWFVTKDTIQLHYRDHFGTVPGPVATIRLDADEAKEVQAAVAALPLEELKLREHQGRDPYLETEIRPLGQSAAEIVWIGTGPHSRLQALFDLLDRHLPKDYQLPDVSEDPAAEPQDRSFVEMPPFTHLHCEILLVGAPSGSEQGALSDLANVASVFVEKVEEAGTEQEVEKNPFRPVAKTSILLNNRSVTDTKWKTETETTAGTPIRLEVKTGLFANVSADELLNGRIEIDCQEGAEDAGEKRVWSLDHRLHGASLDQWMLLGTMEFAGKRRGETRYVLLRVGAVLDTGETTPSKND